MGSATEAEFRDFVAARRHRLLGTAYLLARDRERAERLVQAALARTRRHWRGLVWGGDPEWFALRCIVARHVPQRERSARAAAVASRQLSRLGRRVAGRRRGSASDTPGGEAAGPAGELNAADVARAGDTDDRDVSEAVWTALGGLWRRTWAALVLRYYEDLAEDEAAPLLGCSAAALRAEETRGLAALCAALPGRTGGASEAEPDAPEAGGVEEELRVALARQAAGLSAEHDPYGRTLRGIRRTRWRGAAVSAVCLCLLAAVAVPVAVFRPFRDVPLRDWPVRGSLADDAAFLEAARAEAIEGAEMRRHGLQVDYSRVVYAGDQGGRRRVVAVLTLVPGEDAEDAEDARGEGGPGEGDETQHVMALMRGEAGARPGSLSYEYPAVSLPGQEPAASGSPPSVPHFALTDDTPSGGRGLFVLGPPDTREVAHSPRPRFHPDGTWSRGWRTIPSHDGVAFQELPAESRSAGMVRLRLPDDAASVSVWPTGSGSPSSGGSPEVEGLPSDSLPAGVSTALTDLSDATGRPQGRFEARAIWHGWPDGEAWLLAAKLPNGATFQVLAMGGTGATVALVPRGQARRPLAISPLFEGLAQDEYRELLAQGQYPPPRVLLVAPDHSGHRAGLWTDGRRIAAERIHDGSAVFGGDAASKKADEQVAALIEAGKQEAELAMRVTDQEGRQVHRGQVRTASSQPWNRPGDTRNQRGG